MHAAGGGVGECEGLEHCKGKTRHGTGGGGYDVV